MKGVLTALLLLLALSSCGGPAEPWPIDGDTDPALLQGKPWRLVQFADADGGATPARATLTVQFTGGRFGGMAGPNHYGGAYTATPAGAIALRDGSSTLIGGADAERAGLYLHRMVQSHSFEATATELRLRFAERGFLLFTREN